MPRRRRWRAAAGVVGLGLSFAVAAGACSGDGGTEGSAGTTTTTAPAAPFTAADARFRATFPGAPERSEDDVPAGGQTLRLVQYSVQPDRDTAFAVGWFQLQAPLTADRVDPFLEGAMNGSVSAVRGTLMESRRVDHDGNPAIEYLAKVEGGFVRARTVLHANHKDAYFVQVTGKANDEPRFRAFVDSFELLPA